MADGHVENTENSNENPTKTNGKLTEISILDNFTKLKHSNEQIRIKASVDLLQHLIENKNDEKIVNDEIKYALTRLIRGVGSANQQTRIGYFVVLVGLFNYEKRMKIDEIFAIIDKELHRSGNNTKSENADVSMGKILVVGAIIRSNYYQYLCDNDKKRTIELLLNASKERDYLPLISYNFLIDLFKQIDCDEFEQIRDLVCNEAAKPWQNQSLNSLYLLQHVYLAYPGVVKGKYLMNTLGTSQILCCESLPQLCAILTTISKITDLKHPLYDCVVQQLIKSDLIGRFCHELDKVLLKSNRNRYLIVVKILTKILENLNDFNLIPELIQTNFLQQTINNFKIFNSVGGKLKDKEFQQIINNFFNILLNQLKINDVKSSIKLELIKKFLFYPGTFIFEKITKTKLIQNLTIILDRNGIKELCKIYYNVILAKNDKIIGVNNLKEKWWNLDRIYATSLFIKLFNHHAMNDECDWKIEQLKFLMNLSLFQNNQYDDNIGQELADAIRDTFYTALNLKLTKLDDLCRILKELVDEIDGKIDKDNLKQILRHPIDIDDYEIWQKTNELIRKITKKQHNNNNKKRVFHILFLHLNLQLFNNTKLASDSLKELFNCYQRLKKHKNIDETITPTTTTNDDPLWIEVIIDLFLNLLSHKSRLLRDIINCVFPYLCPYLTIQTVHQIISVIDPKIDENPLSHNDSSSDDDDDDHSDNDEDDDESSDDDDHDIDDQNETINDKFRMALHQALITDNDDNDSIDLDQLNDEDGQQLDTTLSQIFKQFKPHHNNRKLNKQKRNDELLTHFRIRVLDLIEIYLNTNPSLLITIELIVPLLEIYEFCIRDNYQQPLQDRCRTCLKKLTTIKKFDNIDNVEIAIIMKLFNQLLDKGTKNTLIIQEIGEKIADCCVFLINCCQLLTTKKRKQLKIAAILRDNLELFFAKRDCLIPFVLFKNVLQLNWHGILLLIPLLYQVVYTETVRPFRRNQALELLKIFYNNHRFLQNNSLDNVEIEMKFLDDTIVFLEQFYNNPKSIRIREKFLSNLFNLLTMIKQSSKRVDSYGNWSRIGDLIQQCRSIITVSNDTRDNYRKLCRLLKITHVVAMKSDMVKLNHNDDDVDDDDDVVNGEQQQQQPKMKVKKQKHKLSENVLKMKKESKKMRLQSLSEGIVVNGNKTMYNGGFGDDHDDVVDDDQKIDELM